MIVIAWVSLSPPDEFPRLISFPHFDKVVHFLMYLIFCISGIWAFDRNTFKSSVKATAISGNGWIYLIIFLFAVAWGMAMELLQRAMHLGREYSPADLAANITGALIGAGLYYIIIGRKR